METLHLEELYKSFILRLTTKGKREDGQALEESLCSP